MHTKNYFLSFMVAFVFCWTNLAAQEQPFTYVVATDNSGDFTTVQAAVDACKEGEQRSIIFIKNGTYKEMVNVPKGKIISLIGESAEGVLITFDRDRGAGSDFTDFRDITTCQFYGEDMYVEGLTIENSSGNVGQAEAHYVASDRQTYKNCRFLGYQDTQRTNSGARAYFKDCFIQGATDFIFGDGLMYYDNCTVNCVKGGGYVTAPAECAFFLRKTENATGRVLRVTYIFRDCDITADPDVAADTYYLGRPWKEYSGVYYLNCKMGKHIKPQGWTEWNGNEKSACFAEYGSCDLSGNMLDVSGRIDWSFQLAQEDAEMFTPAYVFDKANSRVPYDPVALCEKVQSPQYAEQSGKQLTWMSVKGAIGYVILKNGKFMAATTATTYSEDDLTGRYSIKSIAEHGALSQAVRVENTDKQILKAFPTAEGFGKLATGGRGGKVVTVTNLEDDAEGSIEGSLRWAFNQYKSDFTIVFAVSGRIELVAPLKVKKSNFTVAGQTAPGDGICITSNKVNLGGSSNFILRHIRFRIGQTDVNGNILAENSLGAENCENFIIDHCTFGWSVEENINTFDDHFHTVQWCIVHEGLYNAGHPKGVRGYGCQWGGSSATYHHNLLANNQSRSPRFNGSRGGTIGQDLSVYLEYINNVNYNWGSSGACYGGENTSENRKFFGHEGNFINNYYKPGPATPSGTHYFFNQSLQRDGATSLGPSKWHFSGNIMEGDDAVTADNWKGFKNSTSYSIDDIKVDTIIQTSGDHDHQKYHYDWDTYTYKNYETAAEAYESVLAAVGAWPRDLIDTRIVKSVREGLAPYGNHGIIDLPSQAEGPLAYDTFDRVVDSDGDGMDDAWELANGLSPADPADGNSLTELGYTALEVYLNSLVGENIKHDFSTVGIQSEHADQRLELASTIVTEELEILCDEDLDGAYIYTINGTRIMGVKIEGGKTLSVSGLESGYYIIAVYTKAGDAKIAKFLKK